VGASGWLFLSLIIHWLGVSAYRDLEFERNFQSLLFFSPSVLGAAAAFVLTPTLSSEGEIDLERHYFSVSPWVFRLAAAYTALAGFSDLLVPGEDTTPRPVILMLTAVLLLMSFTARRRIHQVALVILSALVLVNVAVGTR
jgi:hypothetical protein